MRFALSLVLDAAFIFLFAAIGRRNHGYGDALLDVVTTAWPFLAGMTAGWLVVLLAFRRIPLQLRDGIPIWLCAVAGGMVVRSLNQAGTAFSFVVVATIFLGTTLLGWRAVAALTSRPRA